MADIQVRLGDITDEDVEAIVNAANSTLLGGGGVDGAIHRAAGPGLLKECAGLGGCPSGSAKITKGYNLRAKYVIHAVGPVWHGGDSNEDSLLASCYFNSLKTARDNNIRSIAFPAISTGAYRFPLERATGIAVGTVRDYVLKNSGIDKVVFVCFDKKTYDVYERHLRKEGL